MSEGILKALMQLFALVAAPDQDAASRRKVVRNYLASSVKVLRIAMAINEELTHYQKTIVVIQLLEFLNSGSQGISDLEYEFAITVAETFNIHHEEFLAIHNFITTPQPSPGIDHLRIGGEKKQQKMNDISFGNF
jgi:hypothetical protein